MIREYWHGRVEMRNFSPSVEKSFSMQKEKFCISKQSFNVLHVYLLYKHQLNTKPFHFCKERHNFLCIHGNGDLLTCENNMLFSCVKIWCFHTKAYSVIHWHVCHLNLSYFLVKRMFFLVKSDSTKLAILIVLLFVVFYTVGGAD